LIHELSNLILSRTRLTDSTDDDDFDRRPQRRRYEEPLPVRMRRQLLSIAESPLKPVEEETYLLAKLVSDNYDDVETRESFIDLSLQIITEQPFKIPFVAGIIIVINGMNRGEDIVLSVLGKAAQETERRIAQGEWREVKLLLKFLGCLQPLFADEGVWPTLNVLFERAADLQTASSEDV
jgi:nuclear cap-binding protein subunit 1